MPATGIAVSGIALGNPIVITSGAYEIGIDNGDKNLFKIDRVYWFGPTLASTSNAIISKGKYTTSAQIYFQGACEVSGQSQLLNLGDEWWQNPWVNCMPTGTMYIYLE